MAQASRPLRAAAVSISASRICGVRDYAVLLADALATQNVSCSLHWLWRGEGSFAKNNSEVRSWTRGLNAELARAQPDTVLLHYSVFPYSYKGLPLFVRPTLSAVRSLHIPVLTVIHEYAYPWMRGGIRGTAWALSQRALLFEVMRASTAVLVTEDARAQYLASRSWLPRRRVAVAPVFSTLPPPRAGSSSGGSDHVVGLFGYAFDGACVSTVLDALRLLQDRGVRVQLTLLGAPGRSSPAGDAWLAGARARGIARPPSFSGTLPAQALADALADCDVLLSISRGGPMSRNTTLAASLASGRPVVALDGRYRWSELIRAEATLLVAPTANALAEALGGLLQDAGWREALGARGRVFAQRVMSVERSAEVVARLLGEIVS